MGLPASQRRILERIENALRGSDPRLSALFAIFARLNRDEEMPRIEQVRARVVVLLAGVRYRFAAFAQWFGAPARTRLRTAVFFPVALAIVASAVLVGAKFPSASRCPATPRAAADAAHTSSGRSKDCSPVAANPAILGR
jgi:hypothetical protein